MPNTTIHSLARALLIGALIVAPADGGAQQGRTRRDVATSIDAIVRAPVDARQVAGISVAVMKGRDTLFARAYGVADVENSVAATPEHVYEIASVTKEFTGAAVLALVQDGKLSLDDDITRYIPDAPTQGKRITIRQLLSHTSGLVDVPDLPRFQFVKRRELPTDSIIALARGEPPYFPPGEQMRYSNTGFLLAGQLIEKLSGETYADFVAKRLLRPAGMSRSRYCDQRALIPHLARGYDFTPDGFRPASFIDLHIPFAAGGLCSTALDLATWNRVLFGGRIVSPAMLAELVRPSALGGGRETRYGLGVGLGTIAGHRAYHHGGDIDGFTSYLAWFPDDSLSVAVLINTQGPVRPDDLVARIAESVLGPGRPFPAPPNDLARFAGRYGGDVVVTVTGDALTLVRGPLPPVRLRYDGGTTFTDGRRRYTFEPEAGKATTLWADMMWAFVRWDRDGGA